jgi:hypothetical protein
MKKSNAVKRLEALFKDERNPRWKMDLSYFQPVSAGRCVCHLSPVATKFLIDNLCGRHSKNPAFILIEPEGDVRLGGIQVFEDWLLAVKVALDEGVYIYNARSKRCCRPVWSVVDIEDRSFVNMTYEAVRLIPDQDTYDKELPTVRTRLFALE